MSKRSRLVSFVSLVRLLDSIASVGEPHIDAFAASVAFAVHPVVVVKSRQHQCPDGCHHQLCREHPEKTSAVDVDGVVVDAA